jgi:hypothetical protein
MLRGFVALALVAAALAAGCIQPSDPAIKDSPPPSTRNDGGNMTATERTTNSTCSGNGNAETAFCASRTVAVSGSLSGVAKMDVDLKTVNGHVGVRQGGSGSWTLTAVLKAYGATQEEANANLQHVAYNWRHTDGSSHFVQAEAKDDGSNCRCNEQGDLDVSLPSDVVMVVTTETTNGAVSVEGKTDGLSAQTVNGAIRVNADVTQVSLSTTNGQIDATLRPTASGRISASTTNGQVALAVPEDAGRGYDATGRTTNGEVSISLKDGDLGPCPQGSQYYTPPCNERTFKTHGFEQRTIQTTLSATGTNGQIAIRPA